LKAGIPGLYFETWDSTNDPLNTVICAQHGVPCQGEHPALPGSPVHSSVFLYYSGFDSSVYRNLEAKWHFPQKNATLHDLQMATCESKTL